MTTELKPCPFCNYALSMSEGICPAQDCKDEDTGKWTFTGICCPSCAAFLPKPDDNASVPDGVAAWNTRATPDVPELVRYDLTFDMPFGEGADISEVDGGEYVRYDQAAEMLSEARLQQKAWGDKWDHAVSRAEAAEAKLAQINDQKPFEYRYETLHSNGRWVVARSLTDPSMGSLPYRNITPLYAAPVASEAETIERLRVHINAAADDFELIQQRINEDQIERASATAFQGGKEARKAIRALSGKEPS